MIVTCMTSIMNGSLVFFAIGAGALVGTLLLGRLDVPCLLMSLYEMDALGEAVDGQRFALVACVGNLPF